MVMELLDTYVQFNKNNEENQQVTALVEQVLATSEPVALKTLNGGITNQLLKVETPSQRALVRLFGRGTATFINREREYAVHERLSQLGMASPLYCRFGNGLIYGWVSGTPADYKDLSDPKIRLAIAQRLGQWHAQLRVDDIPFDSTIFDAITEWIELAPDNMLQLTKAELRVEFEWFKKNYSQLGGPIVMGHNDLLCGNILLPETTANSKEGAELQVQFIDYEYSQRCPRAFDIVNHFMEWQGYECDTAKIPAPESATVAEWVAAYLQASGSNDSVNTVVQQLKAFWGLPGFYWGVWAVIQSTQSEIDFDYASYAKIRFHEYLAWKKSL